MRAEAATVKPSLTIQRRLNASPERVTQPGPKRKK